MGSILVTAKKVQLSNWESEDPYLCEKFSRCCFLLRAKHIFPHLSSHSSIKTVSILNFAFDFLCKDSDQENYSAYSDAVDLYIISSFIMWREVGWHILLSPSVAQLICWPWVRSLRDHGMKFWLINIFQCNYRLIFFFFFFFTWTSDRWCVCYIVFSLSFLFCCVWACKYAIPLAYFYSTSGREWRTHLCQICNELSNLPLFLLMFYHLDRGWYCIW